MGKGGRGRRFKREGTYVWASQVVIVVKNLPANAGDIRDAGSIPGSGRSLKKEMATPPVSLL